MNTSKVINSGSKHFHGRLKVDATFCPTDVEDLFSTVDWEVRSSQIKGENGELIFEHGPLGDAALNRVTLKPGETFHITPHLRHRMTAATDCDILEASTPELDDVVRLEDRYGRVGARS